MRKYLRLLLLSMLTLILVACGSESNTTEESSATDTSEEVTEVEESEQEPLLVGMEAAYPPYNWTQTDDSNDAVEIQNSTEYANGYDVQIARLVGEAIGREVIVVKTEWEGLLPALQSGKIDMIIAGMSPTAERAEVIDFSDSYYDLQFAMVMMADSEFAEAKTLEDFEGARVTGQLGTLHYDLLQQLTGADVQQAMRSFSVMRVSLQSGRLDAYVSEIPEAISATNAISEFTYVTLDPSFDVPAEDATISIGVKKDSPLLEQINDALSNISPEDREKIMEEAIENQPANTEE